MQVLKQSLSCFLSCGRKSSVSETFLKTKHTNKLLSGFPSEGLQRIMVLQSLTGISEEEANVLEPQDPGSLPGEKTWKKSCRNRSRCFTKGCYLQPNKNGG